MNWLSADWIWIHALLFLILFSKQPKNESCIISFLLYNNARFGLWHKINMKYIEVFLLKNYYFYKAPIVNTYSNYCSIKILIWNLSLWSSWLPCTFSSIYHLKWHCGCFSSSEYLSLHLLWNNVFPKFISLKCLTWTTLTI